ncbi:uncharacterized protein LOC106670889 [Cimex lectularius]|uniref:BTB domain-containing protein n=1 Tax=Cimex lectularius TaxID=79782 RepID=A0A8I6S580_CIMLE|nr:uncharacterized protein LOC106670889 [Cimex lectularius]
MSVLTSNNIDWREEHRSLKEKIKYAFASALFTNITLTVSDGQNIEMFRGHSVFLMMASPVFERMLEGGFKESSFHIYIDDVNTDVFRSFLEFIYFDAVELKSFYEACELYKLGHKYLVVPLQEYCLSYIRQNLNVGTACTGYELADIYDLMDIKRACRQIMLSNTSEVMSHPAFLCVKERTIHSLLEEANLNISEITLFKYVEAWIKAEMNRRGMSNADEEAMKRMIGETIIPKFHFFDMTLKEFTDGPCKSGLLTVEQRLAVFENMASENASPLPEGFTKQRRKRKNTLVESYARDGTVIELACFIKPIVDFMKHRYIYFTSNSNITIKALKFSTREATVESDVGRTYQEKLGVKLWEVSKDCESITDIRSDVEYSSGLVVELSSPVRVVTGRRYTLVMWTEGGDYKSFPLDRVTLTDNGVQLLFMQDPSSPPILPLLAIYYSK